MSRSMTPRLMFLALIAFSALTFNSCGDDCGTCPLCPPQPASQDIFIPAAETGPYCVTYYSGGDTDFAGHGPRVRLKLDVYVTGDSLMFSFDVDATETQSNWTRGTGRWEKLLYQAPPGWRFSRTDTLIAVDRYYIDTNHEMDFVLCGEVNFRGYGDCDGNDIGGSGCVCTRYWVWLDDITVEINKE